jgi:hypothetical protein
MSQEILFTLVDDNNAELACGGWLPLPNVAVAGSEAAAVGFGSFAGTYAKAYTTPISSYSASGALAISV